MKFHVTDAGDVRTCLATARPCRYGEEAHHTSYKRAQAAGEEMQKRAHGLFPKLKKMASELMKPSLPAPVLTGEGGAPLRLAAPTDSTPYFCRSCGRSLGVDDEDRLTQWMAVECPCGVTLGIDSDEVDVALQPSSAEVMEALSRGEAVTLYHVSHSPTWDANVAKSSPEHFFHIGTEDTVANRARDRFYGGGANQFYLFEVEFKPREVPGPVIGRDLGDDWSSIDAADEPHAYLNRWEGPGEISFLSDKRDFTVRGSRPYGAREFL